MGHCTYPGCNHKHQGCFRSDCQFVPTPLPDLEKAIKYIEKMYDGDPVVLQALEDLRKELNKISIAEKDKSAV